jgi:GT2 family glycosyltransferase
MKTAIIIVNWNKKQLLVECVKGLLKHENNRDIFIVDNGSTDCSIEAIREFNCSRIQLFELKKNLGFAGGNNYGINQAIIQGYDNVFLLNNDTIIDEPFIHKIENIFKKTGIKILGPVIVEGESPNIIQSAGGKIILYKSQFPYLSSTNLFKRSEEIINVDYVVGAAMFINLSLILKIGSFDEEFFPAYVEEAEFCHRAKLNGFKSAIYFGSRIRHLGRQSSGNKKLELFRMSKNRVYFSLKYFSLVNFSITIIDIYIRCIYHLFLSRIFKY